MSLRASIRDQVLRRDNYTCRYCGYRPTRGTDWRSRWWRIPRNCDLELRVRDGVILSWRHVNDGHYSPGGFAWMGTLHIDHVIARARGGTDDLDNLVTACPTCNLAKGPGGRSRWK